MFIRILNGGDLTVQIIYRRVRNSNVIVISELAKDVRESNVAKTNYGISMQVQRKTTGSVVQERFYDRDFNRNQQNLDQERFLW
jgi:hypothetical protein